MSQSVEKRQKAHKEVLVMEGQSLRVKRVGCGFQLCPWLAVWPWAGFLTSLRDYFTESLKRWNKIQVKMPDWEWLTNSTYRLFLKIVEITKTPCKNKFCKSSWPVFYLLRVPIAVDHSEIQLTWFPCSVIAGRSQE